MKLTTTKEKLTFAVSLAERLTGKKESLPILSCVMLDAGKGLFMRATNLEAGVEIEIPSDVEERGAAAVPAAILSQTVRSIHSDKISLKSDTGNLMVETRGTKTLIKAIPHDEFPALFVKSSGAGARISREHLLRGIQSVIYAASASMIRPELGSVSIAMKSGGCVFAATDSFRLAEKIVHGAAKGDGPDILIPLRHAGEMAYILERLSDETIQLAVDDAQLSLSAPGLRYVSRVVEGTFPNYKEIMPKSFVTEATLLKGDFSDMLRKARVFSGTQQSVGLHLYPKRKIFTATAQSADVGEMSDSIDAAVRGEDIDINFQISYLADCLPSIESDSITLGFSGAEGPLVVRGASDASFTYLAMPLNR